jgi:Xaa-Pro aminopeptidase
MSILQCVGPLRHAQSDRWTPAPRRPADPESVTIVSMETADLLITVDEYRARRAAVLAGLDGSAAVVFAGTEIASDNLQWRWKSDRFFWYLTGIDYEGGAAVLFDPSAEDPDRSVTLFLRSRDPESERWDGERATLDSALRSRTGFESIQRTGYLPARLTDAARRTKRLACLHPFTSYSTDVSPDFAVFKKVCEHVPGVAIQDRTQLLPGMRAVKSAAELALVERAVKITAAGFDAALKFIRPGVTERAIADVLTGVFRSLGGEPAFEPIVGTGPNSTVLHYVNLERPVQDGDLVVIDYGASAGGYAADVTRTLPANGRFTDEQRRLYDVVLEANLAAANAARPGATTTDLERAAIAVLTKSGHRDHYLHGIGHQLGIEVHDVRVDGPLTTGMVHTIEPGIYLPDLEIGIRIEDDIVITGTGNKNLTGTIPKTVEDIQAAMIAR